MSLQSRAVGLHLTLVSLLISSSLLIPLLAFIGLECLVLSRDDASNITKCSVRVLFLDSRSDVDREQKVGTHVSLGCVRVLLGLFALPTGRVIHRDVVLHLLLVAELVEFRLLDIFLHILFTECLVLGRQNTSHITKGSFRVCRLHIGALGLRVAKESRHGSLGLIGILPLLLLAALGNDFLLDLALLLDLFAFALFDVLNSFVVRHGDCLIN
mmetsp:Transcript_298/g.674  ORF Transcript_298/g.674 Transcript_298/m.674 type:complete len:213 (-) Transcript_298:439-1077(-)